MVQPIRVGLVITMDDEGVSGIIKTLESIRRQKKLLPWYTIVVDNSRHMDSMDNEVIEAMRDFKFFAPGVVLMSTDTPAKQAFLAGIKHLANKTTVLDLYMTIGSGTYLDDRTIEMAARPFWDRDIKKVIGADYSNGNRSMWHRFLDRHVPSFSFTGPNYGSIMMERVKDVDKHLDVWPLMPNIRQDFNRYTTGKVDLYY